MTASDMTDLRVGLIGYGLAGRAFHAPLIHATPGLTLACITTSREDARSEIQARYPQTQVVDSSAQLFARSAELDIVVIAAPNRMHVELARQAIGYGLAVVVDKPLAAGVDDARALMAEAQAAGCALSVFHNRRWDGDFLTLAQLVRDGALGEIRRFESRFERWRAAPKPGWRNDAADAAAGGLLYDLGAHLIDQALMLFGPVAEVHAELDAGYLGAEVDHDSFVALTHASGTRSHLWMSSVAGVPGPRFRVLGTRAAYLKYGMDPQEADLRAGHQPARMVGRRGWGEEPATAWGTRGTPARMQPVKTLPGNYPAYYRQLESALRGNGDLPVAAGDALAGLVIIEAAQRAAREGQVVKLSDF